MRKLKILFIIGYTIILIYVIYRTYQARQADILPSYLTIIGLLGVPFVSRVFDWIFHEDTDGKRKQKEKLERVDAEKMENLGQEHDKEIIYNWLYSKTKKYDGLVAGNIDGGVLGTRTDPRWYSTEDIASSNGFTVDRTRNLCYKHKDIKRMTVKDIRYEKGTVDVLEEKWAIKDVVNPIHTFKK